MTPGEGWLSRFPEDLLTHLLDSPALGGDIRLAALRPDGQAWSTTGFSRLVLAALAPWLTDALLNSDRDGVIVLEGIAKRDVENFRKMLFRPQPDSNMLNSVKRSGVLDALQIRLMEENPIVQGGQQNKATEEVTSKDKLIGSDTFKVVDGKFVCVECEKPFSQKKLLNRHVRTVHAQENPHTCQQCGRRCRSRSELETHLLIHSGSKPHKCNLCQPKDKAFAQKFQLIDHQVKVHKLSDPYTGKPTNCQVCGLVLSTAAEARRHTKVHDKPEVTDILEEDSDTEDSEDEEEEDDGVKAPAFKCDRDGCQRVFKTESALKYHVRLKHETRKPEPLECPHCKKIFDRRAKLDIHIRIHTGDKPYQCSECGKLFSVHSNLKQHFRSMHEAKPEKSNLICDTCDEVFPTNKQLKDHVRHVHNLTRLPLTGQPCCVHCSMTFDKKTELVIHMRESHPDIRDGQQVQGGSGAKEVLQCGFCRLKCISASSLEKHMRTHTGERPHKCEVCLKTFVQKSHVNYHMKTVHAVAGGLKNPVRPKTKVCPTCKATFATASTLAKHIRTHTQERPHSCETCGKRFIQKTHLTVHRRRHTGERPYYCTKEGCGSKGFISSSALKVHMATHDPNRKTFGCSECKAKYFSSADLAIHMRKHSGDKPFMCPSCDKTFSSKRLLEEHARVHDGSKPFFCKNCNKAFTSASGLRKHFLNHDTCKTLSASPGTFSLKPVETVDTPTTPQQPPPLVTAASTTVLMELDPTSNTLVTSGHGMNPQRIWLPPTPTVVAPSVVPDASHYQHQPTAITIVREGELVVPAETTQSALQTLVVSQLPPQ